MDFLLAESKKGKRVSLRMDAKDFLSSLANEKP